MKLKQKWKNLSKKQKIIAGIVAFFLLVLITPTSSTKDNKQNEEQNSANEVVEKKTEGEKPQEKTYTDVERKADFIAFYSEILKIDNQGQATYQEVLNGLEGMQSGTVSALELYVTFKDTKERLMNNRKQFYELKVPESLKEYEKELDTVTGDFSTAYFTLANGVGDMAEYLNTNDMRKYEKANNNIKQYQSFVLTSSLELLEIAEKVGVTVEELPTN